MFLSEKRSPSRELTYPTFGERKIIFKHTLWKGYVSSHKFNICSAFKNTTELKTVSLVASSSIQIYHSNCFISPSSCEFILKETFFVFRRSAIFCWNQDLVLFIIHGWIFPKLHSHQEIRPTLIYDSSSQFCSRNSPNNPQSWNSPLFNTSTIGFLSFNSPPPQGWNFIQVGIESRSHTLDLVVWHKLFGLQNGWAFWQCACLLRKTVGNEQITISQNF